MLLPLDGPPLAIVLNSRAGGGRGVQEWPRLRGELEALGMSYRLIDQPTSAAEALAAVQALPPEWAVGAMGGDGTIAAVLPAVIEQRRPLLVLPFGTGNDFAGMLGLPAGDFRAALADWNAPPTPVDALHVVYGTDLDRQEAAQAYCLNGLGMGFDAQLTANLPLAPSWTRGAVRYLWAALQTLGQMQTLPCEVRADGQSFYVGQTMLCAMMNARSLGGGFQFSPESSLQDGRLNLVLAGDVRRRQVPELIARVRGGHHVGHVAVKVGTAASAELHWPHAAWLHIDGDVKGQVRWLRAEVLSQVVRLLHRV